MEIERPEQSENDGGFKLPDPVMDTALNWFSLLQGYPDDEGLRASFEQWIQQDVKNANAFSEVSGVWELPELDKVAVDVGKTVRSAKPPERLKGSLPFRLHRRKLMNAMMTAAAVIMVAIGVQQYPAMILSWRSDYQTQVGAQQDITLPDGTRMTLNTSSAVSLDFNDGRRTVTLLQGEAYFDVVHDASHPFKVKSEFSEVEVKGTAFSVRNDRNKDTVVLERGVVQVTGEADKGEKAELLPGQSIIATQSGLLAVTTSNPDKVMAWRDGRIIFNNQPFEQVLGELGRYYNHSIIVTSNRIGKARVTGNYRLDSTERTIRSLAATVGGTVTRVPGGILILR